MAAGQARDRDGQWAAHELSDPEIEELARQADEQGYGQYAEPNDQDAAGLKLDREMIREDRRADREEARWARWERRNR